MTWLKRHAEGVIMLLITVAILATVGYFEIVQAAPVDVEECEHVATADTIRIYYCEDINLFINNLGFMAFEP